MDCTVTLESSRRGHCPGGRKKSFELQHAFIISKEKVEKINRDLLHTYPQIFFFCDMLYTQSTGGT